MKAPLRTAALLAALLFASAGPAAPAHAVTIFDNLNDISGSVAYTLLSDFQGIGLTELAFAFVVPSGTDFLLDRLELYVGHSFGGPADLELFIAADAGFTPGAVLETFHLTGLLSGFGLAGRVEGANSVVRPTLTAGQTYWVGASPPAGASNYEADWFQADLAGTGARALRRDGGAWQVSVANVGAFAVQGSVVPEPGTGLLVGAGLFALHALRRAPRARGSARLSRR